MKLPAAESALPLTFRCWRGEAQKGIVSGPVQKILHGEIPAELQPQEMAIYLEDPHGAR